MSRMTNNIVISNSNVPIAIVLGTMCAGKSMVIFRLCQYLRGIGFSFYAENDRLRNNNECFSQFVDSNMVPFCNSTRNFGIIHIQKEGDTKLQIFDFQTEYFFINKNRIIPDLLYRLTVVSNNKIWIIAVDLHSNIRYRHELLWAIEKLQHQMRPSDKIIILVTKADLHAQLIRYNGGCNSRTLERIIQREFPGLLNLFENNNKFTRWLRRYNCDILTFSVGTFYNSTSNRKETFQMGSDIYPQQLWNTLKKYINNK